MQTNFRVPPHLGAITLDLSLNFGLSLHLHPYFEFAGSKGSGESAHLSRHPEQSLLADAISTDISSAGSNNWFW